MRVLLIRHGETEHNIAGLLAGVTDSRLTNHGLIQAQRLGTHLVKTRQLQFSYVFTSDLQRALRTGKEICEAQNTVHTDAPISPIALTLLQEQDFGSFELLPWSRSDPIRQNDPDPTSPDFKPKETQASMKIRADAFLDDHLIPLLALDADSEQSIAVVSHGLFLIAFWRNLLVRFKSSAIKLKLEDLEPRAMRPLEHLPSWSNTGFLELRIHLVTQNNEPGDQQTHNSTELEQAQILNASLEVSAVNSTEHLVNLKRARGGIGSSTSDDKQKRLDNFFKKPKIAPS